MTANAPSIKATATAPGTLPNYRAHGQEQLSGVDFRSIGDGTSSGNYASGGGSDEPIDRASLRGSGMYERNVGFMTSPDRQRVRQWMRSSTGRSNMSGLFH